MSEGPSLPWLLNGRVDAVLRTMQRLYRMLSGNTIVVPGHGYPTGEGAIERHIRHLEDLKTQASAAVAKKLSEQETVLSLMESMNQYSGYKTYPWLQAK